eukprot:Em0017g648a
MVQGTLTLFKKNFHGLMRPMQLKSSVRVSRKTAGTRPCLAEMTTVMTCWKANSFNDIPCKKEVEEFVKCSERVRQDPKASATDSGYKWATEDVNKQLRKFAWNQ